jgi:hypothetical protein
MHIQKRQCEPLAEIGSTFKPYFGQWSHAYTDVYMPSYILYINIGLAVHQQNRLASTRHVANYGRRSTAILFRMCPGLAPGIEIDSYVYNLL